MVMPSAVNAVPVMPRLFVPSAAVSGKRPVESARMQTVLLVEDEAVTALDLAGDLEKWGYVISGIAGSMAEAIRVCDRTQPDIAIIDVALDEGEDGINIARALKERFGTSIIFLTAYTDSVTKSRIVSTDPLGFLFKPYSSFALRDILESK